MKFILGKKLEMTQIFAENGAAVPVTKIAAGPCTVVQVKNQDKDGYSAIQFGYGERKEKNISKPQKGHLEKFKIQNSKFKMFHRYLRELRVVDDSGIANVTPGQVVNVTNFAVGDKIVVSATSKGKGFQGVVKRHGFGGWRATHGNKDQLRMPGSIGAKGPAHVFKGTRMGGRMGMDKITLKNLEIVKIDPDDNVLYLKGAVPGARNGLVMIMGGGEMELLSSEQPVVNNEQKNNHQEKQTDVIKESTKSAEQPKAEVQKVKKFSEESNEEPAIPIVEQDEFDKKIAS